MIETKQYEEKIAKLLSEYFSYFSLIKDEDIKQQWPAFSKTKGYSPRIDVAIGPFSIEDGQCLNNKYNDLINNAKTFLDACFNGFKKNVSNFDRDISEIEINYQFNSNARCFLAIEIEKSGSRKHRLGDIVNVSALGKIGLVIAWDSDILNSFLRIMKYFEFLKEVKKNKIETKNVMILERNQFLEIVKSLPAPDS